MAYQSALHRNTNGGNGLQTSTNTLVNNQTQQTTNTNNGTAVPGAQVHLQQVSKSLSTDSMMTIKYNEKYKNKTPINQALCISK